MIKLLVTLVQEIVPLSTLAQTPVLNFITTTPLITILHIMFVPDHAMVNNIENHSQENTSLHAQSIIQHPLAVK